MKAYQYNINNELIKEYDNVIACGYNFVEYDNNSGRCRMYCSDGDYFTKEKIEETETETNEENQ